MTDMNKNDGLYCLWTEEGVYAARIIDGRMTGSMSAGELEAVEDWADQHLSECETMDDMPTVARPLADAICEQLGLHAELVAVCRID